MVWWLLAFIATIWIIYDIIMHQKRMDETKKLVWIILAVLFNVITAIFYYFMVFKKGSNK